MPKPPPYPSLPTKTPGQRAAAQRAAATADIASPAARPAVLAMLGSAPMKTFLRQFRGTLAGGEPLSNLSAPELLDRLEAELSATELVHNFGFLYPRSCGVDVTIENVPDAGDFCERRATDSNFSWTRSGLKVACAAAAAACR